MPPDLPAERLIRLLIWIGGVAVTALGAWIASKIHVYHQNRAVHLDAIRTKVLIPLRAGLEEYFQPLVIQKMPVVSVVHDAREFKENAKATEEPTEWGAVLIAAAPSVPLLGLIEPALLDDSRRNHFSQLGKAADDFVREWEAYAAECHAWVSQIAVKILSGSGLPAFLPNCDAPYVMHCQLANFVHQRCFRFTTGIIQKEQDYGGSHWMLSYGGGQNVALGTEAQMDAVLDLINGLLESEKTHAAALQAKRARLQASFVKLSGGLDYAIASQRLHGRCDLVAFF